MFRAFSSSSSRSLTSRVRSLTSLIHNNAMNCGNRATISSVQCSRLLQNSSSLSSFNSSSLTAFQRYFSSSASSPPSTSSSSFPPSVLEPLPGVPTTAKPSDPLVARVLSADPSVNNLPPPKPNESDMEKILRMMRTVQMMNGSYQHEERFNRFIMVLFFIAFTVIVPYLKVAKMEEVIKAHEAKNAEADDMDDEELEDAKTLKEEQQKSQSFFHFYSSKPAAPPSLLPPVSNDMFGRPMRTVVLSLHDVLLHAEWRRMEGWRFQKRPHFDEFLQRITEAGYEVVLWCDKPATEVEQLLQDLDPAMRMKHRLFDDSMTREYFALKKDPTLLNRESRRLVLVDYKTDSYHDAQENILKLPRFEGDVHDDALLKLSEILEKIQKYNVYDVATKISAFNHQPQYWRTLFEQEEDDERATLALKGSTNDERKKAAASSVFGGILSNVKPSQVSNSNQFQRM